MVPPPNKQVVSSEAVTEALNRLMGVLYKEGKNLDSVVIDGHKTEFQELEVVNRKTVDGVLQLHVKSVGRG